MSLSTFTLCLPSLAETHFLFPFFCQYHSSLFYISYQYILSPEFINYSPFSHRKIPANRYRQLHNILQKVHSLCLCGFRTSMGRECLLVRFCFLFVFYLEISNHMRFQIFLQIYLCILCKVGHAQL